MADLNTSPPLSRSVKHQTKRKAKKKWLIIALSVVAVLLTAGIVYGAILADKVGDVIDQITLPGSDTVTKDVYGNEVVKGRPDREVRNILVLGIDNRPKFGSLNTDVIMLVSLRPDTKTAVVTSIPRDTYMNPTGWKEGKANSFYAKARKENKDKAYEYVKQIFSEFFEVPIDYVVEVDFKAFEEIVDALGGLTIDVDMDMRYHDPTDGTNINLKKGIQLLNGKETLDFVRYRQSNDGTKQSSDFERNARQQQVVSAIVDKVKSLEVVVRVFEVLDAVGANVKTTIPRDDMLSLIRTYVGLKSENIQFLRLEGTWKSPYVWPNKDSLALIRQTLKAHIAND